MEKEDWCYFRCAEEHAVSTAKLACAAKSMYEPPELERRHYAKSKLAKQYRNKVTEVKAETK